MYKADPCTHEVRRTAGIALLEDSFTMGLLLYILENDGCIKADIYSGYRRNDRIPGKIAELEDAGLVSIVGGQEYDRRRGCVHLTEKGRRLALHIRAISGILGEEGDDAPPARCQNSQSPLIMGICGLLGSIGRMSSSGSTIISTMVVLSDSSAVLRASWISSGRSTWMPLQR